MAKSVREVKYDVYQTSSVDRGRLQAVLTTNPDYLMGGKGWICDQNPGYPQHVILQFDDVHVIRKIQVITHPTLVSRRVDIYVGQPPRHARGSFAPDEAAWTKLGYLAFQDYGTNLNMLKEQKTLFVEATSGFAVKFVLAIPYDHAKNPLQQVGILSIKVWGYPGGANWFNTNKTGNADERPKSRNKKKPKGARQKRRDSTDSFDDHRKPQFEDSDDSDVGHAARIVRKAQLRKHGVHLSSASEYSDEPTEPSAAEEADSDIEAQPPTPRPSERGSKNKKRDKKQRRRSSDSEHSDEMKKLVGNEMKKERAARQNLELPFDHDISEFQALIDVLEGKKADALTGERYLDARAVKEMIDHLKVNEKQLNTLAYKRKLAIEQEDYGAAHDLKKRFQDIKYNTTHEMKRLPDFLTESEQRRFIEGFGESNREVRRLSVDAQDPGVPRSRATVASRRSGTRQSEQRAGTRASQKPPSRNGSRVLSRASAGGTPEPTPERIDAPPLDPDDIPIRPMTVSPWHPNPDEPIDDEDIEPENYEGRIRKNPYMNRPKNDKNDYVQPPSKEELDRLARRKYRNAKLDEINQKRTNPDQYPDERTILKIQKMDLNNNGEIVHVLNWMVKDMETRNVTTLDPRVGGLMMKYKIFDPTKKKKKKKKDKDKDKDKDGGDAEKKSDEAATEEPDAPTNEDTKPAEEPNPAEQPKSAEEPKPADEPKAETPKPAEEDKEDKKKKDKKDKKKNKDKKKEDEKKKEEEAPPAPAEAEAVTEPFDK